jgi:hypothetical protein
VDLEKYICSTNNVGKVGTSSENRRTYTREAPSLAA